MAEYLPRALPPNFGRVGFQDRVRTHERCSLNQGLRHEQPIEWVSVVSGKVLKRQDVRLDDRQDGHIVRFLLMGHDLRQGQPQVQFTQLPLDLDLPQAGNTENELVGRIGAKRSGSR